MRRMLINGIDAGLARSAQRSNAPMRRMRVGVIGGARAGLTSKGTDAEPISDTLGGAKDEMSAAARAYLRGDPDAVQQETRALERLRAAEQLAAERLARRDPPACG